ncbi:LolA-like protein [Streptomyces marincola]|uniref:hypothetical protein n=1 Tax=Streptomyces marincola TaxID=2878388 RepID=UPI001CF57C5C|nr:hypothetical protein [Streptomyces marincola]UCM89851.1 hypothetical protein LC193_18905 [Streptomyces marincola]
MPSTRKVALGAATAALLAGSAACGDAGGSGDGGGGQGSAAFDAVSLAAETTREVTSAEFVATMRAPESMGGDMEMTGSMAWESELAMDLMVSGSALEADPAAPEEVPVVWVDDVMYMDLGEAFAAGSGGRTWVSFDPMALAEEIGDESVAGTMSFGLDSANQDPAQQLALLLESPEIELVGEETLDGAEVSHYRGTITTEDALGSGGADFLTEEERARLVDAMSEQGIDDYHLDVWVDENDLPVRIHQTYSTDQGPVEYEVAYRDFGTEVAVETPPAEETIDFMQLLQQLRTGLEQG